MTKMEMMILVIKCFLFAYFPLPKFGIKSSRTSGNTRGNLSHASPFEMQVVSGLTGGAAVAT